MVSCQGCNQRDLEASPQSEVQPAVPLIEPPLPTNKLALCTDGYGEPPDWDPFKIG